MPLRGASTICEGAQRVRGRPAIPPPTDNAPAALTSGAPASALLPVSDRIAHGIGFALLAFGMLSCADAAVKWLGDRYSVLQIIFISHFFALIPVAFLIRREGGWAALRPRHPWLVALRALLLAVDMVLVFYAFTRLPLTDAYALVFTVPMLVTALSVPILGEFVGWRRWTAVIVGFVGVLIVLRPGMVEINLGHIAAISSALFFALALVVLRRVGKSETGSCLLVSMILALIAVTGPALPYVYAMPSAVDFAVMAGLGLIGGLAHLALIQAFRLAPSAIVAPFHYSQMLWAVLFGLLLFGDRPDFWVVAGATVIIASGLYIVWREAVRGGAARG